MSPRYRRLLPWLILTIAPMILVLWMSRHHSYPRSDKGDHFLITQYIYEKFKAGFWEGLNAAYWHRSWKPVLHPVLAVPFMLSTHGQVLLSVALYTEVLYSIFLIYLYLIFRIFLSPLKAVFGALFLGFLPMAMIPFHVFNTEGALLACLAGSFYHLIKWKNSSSGNLYGYVFWAALALCVRPAESLLYMALPFTVVLCERKPTLKDIGLLSIAVLLSMLWYGSFAGDLFHWIFASTYGAHAKHSGGKMGLSNFSYLIHAAVSMGGFTLALLSALSVILWRKKQPRFLKSQLILFLAFIGAALAPILVGMTTYNATTRYCVPSGIILHFCALFVALLLIEVTSVMQWALLTLSAVFLVTFNILSLESKNEIILQKLVATNWLVSYATPRSEEDPGIEMIKKLQTFISKSPPLTVAIIPFATDSSNFTLMRSLDNSALSLIAHEKGLSWNFTIPWEVQCTNFDENMAYYAKNFDFILVGPLGGPVNETNTPVSPLADTLTKKSSIRGLKKLGTFDFDDSQGQTGKLLFLEALKK
jgi:hypothetical protein